MANDKPAGGWKHGGGTPKPAAGPTTSRKSWQPGTTAAKPAKKSTSRTGRFLLVGGFGCRKQPPAAQGPTPVKVKILASEDVTVSVKFSGSTQRGEAYHCEGPAQ